jgi:hypothetical protein
LRKVNIRKREYQVKKNWHRKIGIVLQFQYSIWGEFFVEMEHREISRNYRRPFKKPSAKKWTLN